MKALEELKELLEKEVEKIARKGEISLAEVEAMYKVVDIIKDIGEIEEMEGGEEEEYSNRGYARRGYSGRRSYGGGSYRRGRDSNGRYVSREGGSYRSYRGYSMEEAKDEMMSRLEEAMNSATNERERQAIMQCMDKLDM